VSAPHETPSIIVNGERRTVSAGTSAFDVVAALDLAARPVAVEVNERVVPRRDLAACMLHDGDRLEIVTLVGGG
jgi:sulfur carrier protein